MNLPLTQLNGEDRTFGGNQLFIDLIPKNCWFSSIRAVIHRKDWDTVRKYIYERANYTCECCGVNTKEDDTNGRIEAHERWHYNENTKTQKLIRIISLCQQCHQVTHFGLAQIRCKGEEAKQHLMKVRNINSVEAEAHINVAFSLWRKRNEIEWVQDLSLVTSNNIKINTTIDVEENCDNGYICPCGTILRTGKVHNIKQHEMSKKHLSYIKYNNEIIPPQVNDIKVPQLSHFVENMTQIESVLFNQFTDEEKCISYITSEEHMFSYEGDSDDESG